MFQLQLIPIVDRNDPDADADQAPAELAPLELAGCWSPKTMDPRQGDLHVGPIAEEPPF